MAQETVNSVSHNVSPAAAVLGIQPGMALSPKSYKALETAFFSNFTAGNSLILPNDLSLEFTPYWAKERQLSLEEYLYPKRTRDQLFRELAISFASSNNFLLGDSSNANGVGIGLRTTIFFNNQNDRDILEAKLKELDKSAEIVNAILGKVAREVIKMQKLYDKRILEDTLRDTIDFRIQNIVSTTLLDFAFTDIATKADLEARKIVSTLRNFTLPSSEYNSELSTHLKTLLDSYNNIDKLEVYLKRREGYTADLAASALVVNPPQGNNNTYISKISFIGMIGRPISAKNYHTANLMARYEFYNESFYKNFFPQLQIYQNNLDLGGNIHFNWSDFSLNLEAAYRLRSSFIPAGTDTAGNELFRIASDNDIQYLARFQYNVNNNVILSYTLGNQFNPILNPGNTLVSLISVNFAFTQPLEKQVKAP